jgi:hypothetical protein
MGFLLGLNAIFWTAGFLLPVPMSLLAWRGWFKVKNSTPAKLWRRKMSQIALCVLTVGLAFWSYALFQEWRGHYIYYDGLAARVGQWGSASMLIPCVLSERKVRTYLLLGAVGLLCYFGLSLGDIAI